MHNKKIIMSWYWILVCYLAAIPLEFLNMIFRYRMLFFIEVPGEVSFKEILTLASFSGFMLGTSFVVFVGLVCLLYCALKR